MKKNPAAVALGKLGGSKNTDAQNAARAQNAKKGGWPKGRPRKNSKLATAARLNAKNPRKRKGEKC